MKKTSKTTGNESSTHTDASTRAGLASRVTLLAGVLLWLWMQGYLVLMPLYVRAALPEPDDTLPYVLRTARMAECFQGECPAFEDLKAQLDVPSPGSEAAMVRAWVASSFGSQHPLFSLLLISLKGLGIDLITAYKLVSTAAVALFALGFAYLLAALYGAPAAGIAMAFLAFKVFPDTGLNFVAPSNLAMGLALSVLGRLVRRRGRAPWILALAGPVMAGIHPIGLLYWAIAAAVAWSLAGFSLSRKVWWGVLATAVGVLVLGLLLPSRLYSLPNYLRMVSLKALLTQGMASLAAVAANVANLKEGLFGSLPLFCAAVAGGYMALEEPRRLVVRKVLAVYGLFLVLVLFYPPREPGDTFFRIWIPHFAMVYGLAGQAAWWAAGSFGSRGGQHDGAAGAEDEQVRDFRSVRRPASVLFLALLVGWWIQTAFAGTEQILVTAPHTRMRQPLHVCHAQPGLLLSAAKPGDRVLYLSMLVMPYYLIQGCTSLGAVYYHDALKDSDVVQEWLSRPDIRFAVAYNPLYYHPSFEGRHERRWTISAPVFRFSPWNEPRIYGPVLEEDAIPMDHYKWVEIEPTTDPSPHSFTVTLEAPQAGCRLRLTAVGECGEPLPDPEISRDIGADDARHVLDEYEARGDVEGRLMGRPRSLTRVELDLQPFAGRGRRLRLTFSPWKSGARLAGLAFDGSPRRWPWDHKARVTLMHRKWEVGPVNFAFDPALILPEPVNHRDIEVMDDCGSSVLFRIGR